MASRDESLENHSKHGGARPGAGRKPGGQNQTTKERAAIKQAFLDRIYAVTDKLFEAQYKLAVGYDGRPPDAKALDSLLDRAFGKAQDHVDVTTNGRELGLTPEQAEQLIRARTNRSDPE